MNDKVKRALLLVSVIIYCALSWILMRYDYFVGANNSSALRQFIHLGATFVITLGLILWKGQTIEKFIDRLSQLPMPEKVAPFLVSVPFIFTMLQYPQSLTTPDDFGLGLMESTRSFIMQLFLAGTVLGTTSFSLSYLRRPSVSLVAFAGKILFLSPRAAFVGTTAFLLFAIVNILSYFQFHHLPLFPEEVMDLFQARIFSTGHASAAVPQMSDFFAYRSMLMSDRWFSPAPPGNAILLSIGILARAPWLINPLLAAFSIVLLYSCAEQMYDERIARGTVALMLVSPFVLLLSSLYLPYIPLVFFLLLSLSLLLKGLHRGQPRIFFFSGLAFGGAILIAPLLAIALAFPWFLFLFRQVSKGNLPTFPVVVLFCGPTVSIFLLFACRIAAGGYSFAFWPNDAFSLGSGYESGFFALPQTDTNGAAANFLLHAFRNLNNRLHYFSIYLLGWPLPALLMCALPFAAASRNKSDYLLLGQLVCVPLAFILFFHHEFVFGPRYYFVMAPAGLMLAARGFQSAPLLRNRLTGSTEGISREFLGILILLCVAFNLTYFLPARLKYSSVSSYAFKTLPCPVQKHVKSAKIHNAVVFINDFPFYYAYGAGLWLNDPTLRGDVIYARDFGKENLPLMKQYSGRKYYRYNAFVNTLEEIFPDSAAYTTADYFKPHRRTNRPSSRIAN